MYLLFSLPFNTLLKVPIYFTGEQTLGETEIEISLQSSLRLMPPEASIGTWESKEPGSPEQQSDNVCGRNDQ